MNAIEKAQKRLDDGGQIFRRQLVVSLMNEINRLRAENADLVEKNRIAFAIINPAPIDEDAATPISDKALEVIAGRKHTAIVYKLEDLTFLTDADLARELIEARKEIERLNADVAAYKAEASRCHSWGRL